MAPSATTVAQNDSVQEGFPVTEESQEPGEAASVPTDKPASNGKNMSSKASQPKIKPPDTKAEGKPSNKELKDKAKAEKAARRAREKQGQQGQPVVDLGTRIQGAAIERKPSTAGSTQLTTKTQHEKPGTTQKSMPLRPAHSDAAPAIVEPKRENKNVALLDHLYGPPRRSSLAGAGKDVHPAILALGLQMRNYVVCGSTARCVSMLLAFKRVIDAYTTPIHTSLPRHLTSHLSSQIDYLVSCRPLSISMGNAIRWLKLAISKVDISTQEMAAKADLCRDIDNFIQERITVAGLVIANKIFDKIQDGDVLLTFAKSSVVQKALVEAFQRGKKFKVIVVDSRPLYEGKNLARALADLGLDVQYSLTHTISHVIKNATKVLLGAHAMTSNGCLYSRVGTALIGMSAKEANIPVIVCCETIKFTDRVPMDSFVYNEIAPPEELILEGQSSSSLSNWESVANLQLLNLMYDLTPAEYISMVVTEDGFIPPSSVPVIHRLKMDS